MTYNLKFVFLQLYIHCALYGIRGMKQNNYISQLKRKDIMKYVIRFLTAIFSFMIVSMFIPGFMIYRFQTAIMIGLVITLISWVIEAAISGEISPFAKAILTAGITAGTLLLFSMTHLVSINLLGTVIAAILTGTVDLFLPNYARFTR